VSDPTEKIDDKGKKANSSENNHNSSTAAAKPENAPKPENANSNFDWITARSSCTLPNIFKQLRLQIEQDVKIRNSLRPPNAPYEFALSDQNGGFRVVLKADTLNTGVSFVLAEHAILVRDNSGTEMFAITLTFTDRGECKLNVNSEERDFWQVRRMALEDLMFHSN
jgi:hypothetical protein